MSVLSRQRLPGPPAYAVVCDHCSVMKVASLDGLRALGWQIASLEETPHLCASCANGSLNGALNGALNGERQAAVAANRD
jgi:hypothetical protein